jgi:NADPH:quinone reductase-like Zn-dependent oxidoreductase
LSSGDPPFTPGIEGGGLVDAVGAGATGRSIGQRVTLGAGAPRRIGGTYRSHCIVDAADTIPVPDSLPDVQLGALWLTYLTAWGCLIWKQALRAGQYVALPAASSGVALAAAQIAQRCGATVIGLTSSEAKAGQLRELPEADYDEVVATGLAGGKWHHELKRITGGHGIDIFFDPVAAGAYLDAEIRALAQHGVIWVYGLLGAPDRVDVGPLIRKYGAIRGWLLSELTEGDGEAVQRGYREILEGFAAGHYRQRIAAIYPLAEVRAAHEAMERGEHIGKLILVP